MAQTAPILATARADHTSAGITARDRRAYELPALAGILLLAAALYTWDISHSQYHAFYANAARSMSQSWKAFFFGSFDPANSITIDKLPGFLWPQALSARIFGFHAWALTLPQVLEGLASVLVLFRAVRRWMGPDAALIACGALAVTPAATGLFRTAVEEPAFTLCLLLAADATQRAARSGRLRSLVLAGVWVGVAFQAKMLEAWAVLPALAVVYLLSAPAVLRKRIVHVLVAGVVTVAVSLSWMIAVTLTPAKDRPYIDGTTDNSAFSMVVGYNFLNRFSSVGISASSTGSVSAVRGGGGGGHHAGAVPGGAQAGPAQARGRAGGFGGYGGGGGNDGWSKLVAAPLASQTGWFYPTAIGAFLCGLLWRRRSPRTDGVRAGFLLWGTWLGTYALVLSAGSVAGHTYYMGVLAVALAALVGGGVPLMWRAYRAGGRQAWALPTAVAATTAWGAYLTTRFSSFLPWLTPTVLVLGAGAVTVLVLGRPDARRGLGRKFAVAGLVAGAAAMAIAPAAWVSQVFRSGGGSGMGAVGPSGAGGGSGRHGGARMQQAAWRQGEGAGAAAGGYGGGSGGFGSSSGTLTPEQAGILAYTQANRGKATYVFATTSWSAASPYILAKGADVLPIGGFTGQVPFPTTAQFERLVATGKVKFVDVTASRGFGGGGGGGGGGRGGSGGVTAQITSWVESTCSVVPSVEHSDGSGSATLYSCAP